MRKGTKMMDASIILVDVGPSLGALNHSALIATAHVVAPLAADVSSLEGLRNLGPVLARWRNEWSKRLGNRESPSFPLPKGDMRPLGYVVQQHLARLGRPIRAYDKWIDRIPEAHAKTTTSRQENGCFAATPSEDRNRLATVRRRRSLVPMAQEARRPVFALTAGGGAIGGHATAVRSARDDFRDLASRFAAGSKPRPSPERSRLRDQDPGRTQADAPRTGPWRSSWTSTAQPSPSDSAKPRTGSVAAPPAQSPTRRSSRTT